MASASVKLALLAGFGAAVTLGLGALARAVMFPGCDVAFPSEPELSRYWPGTSRLECVSEDGLRLVATWTRAADADATVALYFHGNAESAAQNLDLAAELRRRGVAVVLAEYRGYGGMPGAPSEEGLYRDGEAVVKALLARGISPGRLALVGRSLGTGVAVELARRGHGRALVLIAPFTSAVDLGRGLVGPLAPLLVADRFDNAAKVGGIRVPVTVIQGTEDEVVPVAMGRTIASLAPHGRFVPVPGRGHNDLDALPERIAEALGATPAAAQAPGSPPAR